MCFYTDAVRQKIPNVVTLPAVGVGVLVNLGFGGLDGLRMSGIGFGIGFGALYLLFLLRSMGGGDVKLMAAIGALKGFPFVVSALLYSFLVGGFIGIAVLIWKRKFRRTMLRILHWIVGWVLPIPSPASDERGAERMPFGIAIVIGTVWAEVMRLLGTPDIVQLWRDF